MNILIYLVVAITAAFVGGYLAGTFLAPQVVVSTIKQDEIPVIKQTGR